MSATVHSNSSSMSSRDRTLVAAVASVVCLYMFFPEEVVSILTYAHQKHPLQDLLLNWPITALALAQFRQLPHLSWVTKTTLACSLLSFQLLLCILCHQEGISVLWNALIPLPFFSSLNVNVLVAPATSTVNSRINVPLPLHSILPITWIITALGIAIDLFYCVTAEPLTTIAHVCAIILGIFIGLFFCKPEDPVRHTPPPPASSARVAPPRRQLIVNKKTISLSREQDCYRCVNEALARLIQNSKQMQREDHREVLKEGRWLRFYKSHYSDEADAAKKREYECFERTTTQGRGWADGVDIVAVIKQPPTLTNVTVTAPETEDLIVLIEQYRPPVDTDCLEFPAGLVEKGEDPVDAALRELREETGLVANRDDVLDQTPLLFADPSITSDSTRMFVVRVDGALEENKSAKQKLEEDEHIQVHLVPRSKLRQTADKFAAKGYAVDVKVYAFALALDISGKLQSSRPNSQCNLPVSATLT